MEAQVSKVSPKPLSVTPVGPFHPRSASDEVNHSCAERVATVATPSTMARHAGSRATSSDATKGTMPKETASTATSKSLPATSVSVPVPSRGSSATRTPPPGRCRAGRSGRWASTEDRRPAPAAHNCSAPATVGLPGELDRLDRVPVRDPEVVQAPEEAELDAAANECLVHGREDGLAVPAFIRQKIDPLKSKSIRPASWSPRPAAKPGLPWSPPSYEGEVMHARTIGDCSVSGAAPCFAAISIVEVVDGVPPLPGQESVDRHALKARRHQVDQLPVRRSAGSAGRWRACRRARSRIPASGPQIRLVEYGAVRQRDARAMPSSSAAAAVRPPPDERLHVGRGCRGTGEALRKMPSEPGEHRHDGSPPGPHGP